MINITYEAIEDIYTVELAGNISKEDIIESFKTMDSIDKNIEKVKIIIETNKCNFLSNISDLNAISNTFESFAEDFKEVRQAFLIDSSFYTALGTIYFTLFKKSKIKNNIFVTKEAAIRWLNL